MTFTIKFAGEAFAQETDSDGDTGESGSDAGHGAAETHSETGVAHGEGEAGAFPPFDPSTFASQLLWLAITFGIFYWLMGRVIIPRIGGILETRSDRISQDLDEAQRLNEESEAAQAAYEHELAEARNRAHKIGQEARDKAKAEADSERERVEAELAKKLEKSESQIEDIKRKAMAQVDDIAKSTTEEIVKQLLGTSATKTEIDKAVKGAAKEGGK